MATNVMGLFACVDLTFGTVFTWPLVSLHIACLVFLLWYCSAPEACGMAG